MKRKRGRPRKFTGDKDRATFPQSLEATLPAVVDFILLAQYSERKARGTHGDDRYQWALGVVSKKYGMSPRTLERLHQKLKRIATEIAHAVAREGAVPLTVEYLPNREDDPPG